MVASKSETIFDKGFVIIIRLVFFYSVGTVNQYEEGGGIICKLN
jgi:hypothetical protein